jgi:nitroreductase
MELHDLESLVKRRRTIRQWKKQEVPDQLIRKAVELATWAPNGGNYQGWQFIAVKDRGVITRMAGAVQSVADRVASWPQSGEWAEDMERYRANSSFFRNAPVCIGVFIHQYIGPMDKALMSREPFDPEAGKIIALRKTAPTAVQSAAAAVMVMLLAFEQMGLGAAWLGAPLMAKKEVESILNVPEGLNLVCLIAVGYPDEAPQKDRRPVEEVLQFI